MILDCSAAEGMSVGFKAFRTAQPIQVICNTLLGPSALAGVYIKAGKKGVFLLRFRLLQSQWPPPTIYMLLQVWISFKHFYISEGSPNVQISASPRLEQEILLYVRQVIGAYNDPRTRFIRSQSTSRSATEFWKNQV